MYRALCWILTAASLLHGQPLMAQEVQEAQPIVDGQDIVADPNREMVDDLNRQMGVLQERLNKLETARPTRLFLSNAVSADSFMAPPADPNNPFFTETNQADVNLGSGSAISGTGLIFRAAANGSIQMWYDTGYVGAGAAGFPETIEVDGTNPSQAGFFGLEEGNANFKFDLQAPLGGQSSDEQIQAYIEPIIRDGDIQIRHGFTRVQLGTVNILAGKYWTAWADEGTYPKSLQVGAFSAGALAEDLPPQLRLAIPSESGWVTTLAVQQPRQGDFDIDPGSVVLQRWPDLAARIRYFDDDYFSVSLGTLVRVLGEESPVFGEEFATAWGVSLSGRIRTTDSGALMAGFSGGQGIAGSITGLTNSLSAVQIGNRLDLITNSGVYAGYQQHWTEYAYSTFAYGFARGGGVADSTRHSQNAWANLVYEINENFAFGVEYQYGQQDLVAGASGDNHRLSFVLSLTASPTNTPGGSSGMPAASSAMSGDQADGQGSPTFAPSPIPASTGVSRFGRL